MRCDRQAVSKRCVFGVSDVMFVLCGIPWSGTGPVTMAPPEVPKCGLSLLILAFFLGAANSNQGWYQIMKYVVIKSWLVVYCTRYHVVSIVWRPDSFNIDARWAVPAVIEEDTGTIYQHRTNELISFTEKIKGIFLLFWLMNKMFGVGDWSGRYMTACGKTIT